MTDEGSHCLDQALTRAAICGQRQTASLERVRQGIRHISADAVATAKPAASVPRSVAGEGRGGYPWPWPFACYHSGRAWHSSQDIATMGRRVRYSRRRQMTRHQRTQPAERLDRIAPKSCCVYRAMLPSSGCWSLPATSTSAGRNLFKLSASWRKQSVSKVNMMIDRATLRRAPEVAELGNLVAINGLLVSK